MAAIRVLTTEPIQERWCEVQTLLNNEPGIELVGRVKRLFELLLAVRSTKADAVILFTSPGEIGILSHLFSEFPNLIVLTLCSSGTAFIEEICPTRRAIHDVSPTGVLHALRNAISRPCAYENSGHLQ